MASGIWEHIDKILVGGFGLSILGTMYQAGKLANKQQEHTEKLKELKDSTDENKKCLVNLKLRSTDFLTDAKHDEKTDECRKDIFREIARDRTDITEMKDDIKDLTDLVVETNSLVRQVIAIQEGTVK